MARRVKRVKKKRHPGRALLILVFVVVGVVAAAKCFIRPPEIPTANSNSSDGSASAQSVSNQPDPLERKTNFYTILVSGEDDENGGSDTNILVALDAENGSIHCVSIPRDSGVYIDGKIRKINFAYNKGGTDLLRSTVSDLLGIPVDFYVSVDLEGFVALVDAIGGVDFEVPINMNYDDPIQGFHVHLNKGMQHLTGEEAMGVVRFRHNNDGSGYGTEDIGRIATQQAFLKAVAQQVLQPSNLTKVGTLAQIFQDYVDTDLTVGNLAWMGQQAFSIGTENIAFYTLEGEWSDPRSLYLVDPEAALTLVNQYFNPYVEDRTAEDLNIPT